MTFEQMQDVIANCEDFCKMYHRRPYFYITGGDPILHPDFWKLMVLLKSKEIPFTLMGNPFHLNDEICRMLKVCGCEKYQMSLDGMRETHDWFRKPGSFDLTLEKVGCMNRANIKSVIMSTVSKTNMKEIPDIIDEVVKAKVKIYAFSRYVPTGGEVDTSMTPQEYREVLEICDAKYKVYQKLSDVWICQMEQYREYDKFKKCSKCELKAWCRGCPAVANSAAGDFYGADPQCWKVKNDLTGEEL